MDRPAGDLVAARELIERCGYGRRQHALEAAAKLGEEARQAPSRM